MTSPLTREAVALEPAATVHAPPQACCLVNHVTARQVELA